MRKRIASVLVWVMISGMMWAQDVQTEQAEQPPLFKGLIQDQEKIWSAPFHFKTGDWLIVAGVGLLTGVSIKNDEAWYRDIKDYQAGHGWVDWLSPEVTKLGDGRVNCGLGGLFLLSGWLAKDHKAKQAGKLILLTYVHTGIVVQVLKHFFSRQRPSWDNGQDHWYGPAGFFKRYEPYQISKYDAFPSGHTISVWGTASVLAHLYNKTFWIPALCYTLATATMLSRVTEDTHWLSDCFVSAAMGFAIGKFLVKSRYVKKTRIIPTIMTKKKGAGVTFLF